MSFYQSWCCHKLTKREEEGNGSKLLTKQPLWQPLESRRERICEYLSSLSQRLEEKVEVVEDPGTAIR
jgi:hypothetical protein